MNRERKNSMKERLTIAKNYIESKTNFPAGGVIVLGSGLAIMEIR